uniref:Uncharacterized protein n=1 Tax=Arion vulgaris TaxID=1028688 RepID=A0A0B6ZGY7_9EUPU
MTVGIEVTPMGATLSSGQWTMRIGGVGSGCGRRQHKLGIVFVATVTKMRQVVGFKSGWRLLKQGRTRPLKYGHLVVW